MALVVGLLMYSRKCRVPHILDFLLSLIEPANFMRLSLMKAAHAALAQRTGNPGISLVFREMWDATNLDPWPFGHGRPC